MPLDMSIYQNLLAKPKTVAEYDQEAMTGQQNRLALQMGQQKADEYTRSVADSNKLRGVVAGFGADQTANYNALLGAGRLDEAQKYQKNNADIGKTNADVAHLGAQTDETHQKAVNLKMTQAKDMINTIQTPEQAALWVKGMYADPDLGKVFTHGGDTAAAAIARIPTDPAKFQQWKMQSSLGADKLIEFTTPTANTVANNQTSAANTAANNATQIRTTGMNNATSIKTTGMNNASSMAVQKAIADRQPDGTKLAPEDITTMAQQYLAGDKSVLQGLGRGMQGAEDIRAVRAEIGKQLRSTGLTGADQAAKLAEYAGMTAGMRATGNISARVENAVEEAAQLAPLALSASREVARSGFLPFGKAQVMFDTNTNDPALAKFATANMGLATAYASAMARGNKPTVSDMEHSRSLLSTAKDQTAYDATVQQMMVEMQAAKRAPRNVRASLSGEMSGRGGHDSAPAGGKPSLDDIFGAK